MEQTRGHLPAIQSDSCEIYLSISKMLEQSTVSTLSSVHYNKLAPFTSQKAQMNAEKHKSNEHYFFCCRRLKPLCVIYCDLEKKTLNLRKANLALQIYKHSSLDSI